VCFRRLRGGVASFYGVRCGEDGDGAVLQKLRFVSGVVVFVVAAVAVQTVEARRRRTRAGRAGAKMVVAGKRGAT